MCWPRHFAGASDAHFASARGTATGTTREYIWLPEVEIAPASADAVWASEAPGTSARSQIDRPIAVVNAVNTATPATWPARAGAQRSNVSVDHLNRPLKMTDAAKASVLDAVWQPWGGVHSMPLPLNPASPKKPKSVQRHSEIR